MKTGEDGVPPKIRDGQDFSCSLVGAVLAQVCPAAHFRGPAARGPAARGQTDLEVFVEKLLNRSDPEATWVGNHPGPPGPRLKSKCLARVKIARTSAGPPSLTISDPSRFRFPQASRFPQVKQKYDKELQQAETDSKKIQLEEHLDKELIRNAKIKGITGKSILALESFGIESAKDVEMLKTQKVPGIGPVLSGRLFEWRERIERSFIPKQALPESERSRIASRFAPELLPLGQAIQTAIRDLEGITASHRRASAR